MSTETQKRMSAFDIFSRSQESLDEARRKSSEESRKSSKYFRISSDGTYPVRILPLAPVINADGEPLPMERKGYEYPVRELLLKIKTGVDNKGKDKFQYLSVCNAKYKFPELQNDLIELYVQLACESNAKDEKLCKKIKSTSFNGGLKYDSKRCMYVLDLDKRGDGLQILQLSYSQYKDLEDRKLDIWTKLSKNKGEVPCPISSITDAYPVEIKRSNDNGKTEYSFTIDTLSAQDKLSDEELQALLDAPRLPEVIYRYSRYHLEAVIAFLKQYDEEIGLDIMSTQEIKDCIEQIKLCLPADDTSHFSLGGDDPNNDAEGGSLDSLWDLYDKLLSEGLDDKSEEGQELRASIKEYIESNELEITVTRRKTNHDLLIEIEELVESGGAEEEEEEEEEEKAPEKADKRETPKFEEEEEEEETDDEPASPRAHNDDTNEPAVHSRRSARPTRRR